MLGGEKGILRARRCGMGEIEARERGSGFPVGERTNALMQWSKKEDPGTR